MADEKRRKGLMEDLVPMQDHSMGPAGNMRPSGMASPSWGPLDVLPTVGAVGMGGLAYGVSRAFGNPRSLSLPLAGAVGAGFGNLHFAGRHRQASGLGSHSGDYNPQVPPDLYPPEAETESLYGGQMPRPRRLPPQGF